MSGDLQDLSRTGRFASLLCRLARDRFTGVVYVEHSGGGGIFSLRDGDPVFVRSLGEEPLLADRLLEQGVVTQEQYVEISEAVIAGMADDEDMAFCVEMVDRGIMTRAQLDRELEQRVRGWIIQSVGWDACKIELDEDPDSLGDLLEYPQRVGPLVYVGVRTFYDDAKVRALLAIEGDIYVRLMRSAREAAQFFALEVHEAELLGRLSPDRPFEKIIEGCRADLLESQQLLCMLVLADMVELGSAPMAAVAERSGLRDARTMKRSRPAFEGVREERVGSVPKMKAVTGPAFEGVREERVGSVPKMKAVTGPAFEGVREERVGSVPKMKAVTDAQIARATPSAEPAPRPAQRSSRPVRPSEERPPSRPLTQRAAVQPSAARPISEPQPTGERRDAPGVGRPPRRKLGAALKQLDRELKQKRAQSAVPHQPLTSQVPSQPMAPSGPVSPPAAATSSEGPKAHLRELVRLRQQRLQRPASHALPTVPLAPPTASAPVRAPAELFRAGQDALRDQQFPKALDLLRRAFEGASDNDLYEMYAMYAALRTNSLPTDQVAKLRSKLRDKVTDDNHKAFCFHALGHLSLFEKKDDAAAKFFQRAVDLDKNNKDAERFLRVIELRRKTAAAEEKGNKIFGIEIRSSKKSDKDAK